MDIKFSVGEMAKLNGISKQMLIYYDKENIFKPKIVNSENGYRFYTPDQVEELDSILILREMGFSLKDIKAYMKNRFGSNTLETLKLQDEEIQKKIEHFQMLENRLHHKIQSVENFLAKSKDKNTIIECEEEYLAIQKTSKPFGILQVDIALKKLFKYVSQNEYLHFYQIGDMISAENLQKGNYISFDYAFSPLEKPCEKAMLHIKPKGLYAHIYHRGSYQSMPKTYDILINQIKEMNYKISGYSYEYCIFDCLTSNNQDDYITEIQIKVEKV
ncbi:MAG: MerR family transcriptional regulator [Oscillospiraceae bacterium]